MTARPTRSGKSKASKSGLSSTRRTGSSAAVSRQNDAETTRDNLIDHALTLFSERGYSATSVRDIIHAAGVTQPTLYYHFIDKQSLFQALIERHYGDSQDQLEQIISSESICETRLRMLIQQSFQFCCADPRVPRLMFQTCYGPQVPEIDGILDRLSNRRFQLVTQIMQEGMAEGRLIAADPEFLALSFCCLMDQPINIFSRRSRPKRYLTPELAEALIQLFLRGCGNALP